MMHGRTFVLVHGGWHGAWCWRYVAPLLQAGGHRVVTPTLTGLGERAHLLREDIGLDQHVDDVVSLLEQEDLSDVTLVGHSYAGMVIAVAAARAAQRIAHLVYLDAFVPADGQSLFDLLPPQRRAMYEQQAREHGGGWRVPPPPARALGVTDEDRVRWLTGLLTPQPLRTFTEPVRLPGPALPAAIGHTYLHCTSGPTAPSFAPFAQRLGAAPGWRYGELETGHDAMVTVPGDLAALLLAEVPEAAGTAG